MAPPRVLAIVLAGGQGSRLGPLTVGRAKPSLPIGGHYRLIDVSLSNASHSGLTDVWVLSQYEPHLLNEHMAGGRPWDLDRTRGGFRSLPPFQGQDRDGFASGNADALAQNWPVINAFDPDVLLVCSADHLFHLDYRPVIAAHLERQADATMVTTTVRRNADAARFLVVQADDDGEGTVSSVDYKPERPGGRRVSTEVFVYRPDRLREALSGLLDDGGELGDYGERLIPRMVEQGRVTSVSHDGHWQDMGTPEAYLDGQLALLRPRPPLLLDDPAWPILTSMPVRAPARVHRTAEIERAWLSPGSEVSGTVIDAIIGPGVVVEPGADVRHSVIMGDVVIRSGATVHRSVIAEGVTVGKSATVGPADNDDERAAPVLVGARHRIGAGAVVEPGAQLEPREPRKVLRSAR